MANERKTGRKVGGAVTGVAAVAVLAVLLGSGKLGLGDGLGLGNPNNANENQEAIVETNETPAESTAEAAEGQSTAVEIRIQGREYNYQNVSYGTAEHPIEDLMTELEKLPTDTRIDLIVEENATKNAVDDLENALTAAGFQDIHK